MQDFSRQLREFMEKTGLTQQKLAKKAGISQSTVSRALRQGTERHSAAREKLCIYAGMIAPRDGGQESDPRNQVLASFDRIWDHSDGHALAIARVIDALGELGSTRTKEEAGQPSSERERRAPETAA